MAVDKLFFSNATKWFKWTQTMYNKPFHCYKYCVFNVLMFCLLAATQNSAAQNGSFHFVGPGGGGAQFFPAINPHDHRNLFVACDMGGAYVSYDQGGSWRMFNLVNAVKGYVFDPARDSVVYALSTGVFQSIDKGNSWKLLFPSPGQVDALVSKGDHAEQVLITKDNHAVKAVALAVDPANRRQLYLIATEDRHPFLYSSSDLGRRWRKEKVALPEGTHHIFIDPLSPARNRSLYLAGDSGLLQRKNGCWSFKSLPVGVNKLYDYSAGVDPSVRQFLVYAVGEPGGGIYLTADGGITWSNLSSHLGSDGVAARTLAVSAEHANTAYVSYHHLPAGNGLMAAGVARSDDRGKTWRFVWKDIGETAAANFSADWLNERFGPTWGENPLCLTVAADEPSFCMGTDLGRTVLTTDGGGYWEQVYSRHGEGGWRTRGLEVTTNYDIVRDPFDSRHRFILYTDIGLSESFDEGIHWQSATRQRGIPDKWVNSCYDLLFDSAVQGRAWAAMSGIHDLPRPKMFRKNGTRDFNGGILFTEDGAKSWQVVSSSIGEAPITDLLLDPASPTEKRTLYACAFGKGVYKSTDGGRSWQPRNKGIDGNEPFAWRISRRANGDLLLIVSRRSEDNSIGTEKDGALYLSDDGAESWRKIPMPAGTNGPTSIVSQPGLLLFSAWGRPNPGIAAPDEGGGIYRSTDEGGHWEAVLTKDQHIHDITFDPHTRRYYACGFNGSAYYSMDDGLHWHRIKGYDFKWGKLVRPDPDDREKIYILTFGGGVWHGPATGDPDAKESILTPLQRLKK